MYRQICAHCGHLGRPASHTPGTILIEIVLWLCLIVPGIVYSLWRHSARREVCAKCGSDQLLPLDTPRGAALQSQYHPAAPTPPHDSAPVRPSPASTHAGHTLGRLVGRLIVRVRR